MIYTFRVYFKISFRLIAHLLLTNFFKDYFVLTIFTMLSLPSVSTITDIGSIIVNTGSIVFTQFRYFTFINIYKNKFDKLILSTWQKLFGSFKSFIKLSTIGAVFPFPTICTVAYVGPIVVDACSIVFTNILLITFVVIFNQKQRIY